MELIHIGINLVLPAFLINFVWEVWHSELYTTCHSLSYWNRIKLLTKLSMKDAVWIVVLYWTIVHFFSEVLILNNTLQLSTFCLLALAAGYITEYTALKWERWEYAPSMPVIIGVGLTPLLELVVTGIRTSFLVFQLG